MAAPAVAQAPVAQAAGRRRALTEALVAYVWIAPAVLIIGLFHFLPVLYAVYISTFRWGLIQGRFLGLGNYQQALTDGEVWNALLVSVYYVVGTIPVALTSAFLVAYLLFQKINFRDLYRTVLFLPYVTSTVAAAMVFSWVFHP